MIMEMIIGYRVKVYIRVALQYEDQVKSNSLISFESDQYTPLEPSGEQTSPNYEFFVYRTMFERPALQFQMRLLHRVPSLELWTKFLWSTESTRILDAKTTTCNTNNLTIGHVLFLDLQSPIEPVIALSLPAIQ